MSSMTATSAHTTASDEAQITGEFIDAGGERFYAIRNVDQMAPFFVSVISDVDHWLFVSSSGGLTAGRVSPVTALFPYITVDKIHDSTPHTGPKTIFRVAAGATTQLWEPFNREHDGRYVVTRHLYKNVLGNKLCFEEINHDLQLQFRYTWATSSGFGFVRQCALQNLGGKDTSIELVDGLQNLLPAGTPAFAQTNTSNLVDAYKWSELDEKTGLAFMTLYSRITDRAEPSESLKANTVFHLGLEDATVLISSDQLGDFRRGATLKSELNKRGIRCAYFVSKSITLAPNATQQWRIVADVEQSQGQVVSRLQDLASPERVSEQIDSSIASGTDKLARIMAKADAYQMTAEENVSVHHYANVLFNVLRGGVFDDQYNVSSRDFIKTVRHFNRAVFERNEPALNRLPEKLTFAELLDIVRSQSDPQLVRLAYEYLPITFGRRHGDPSRPWNQFAINLKDERGNDLLSYEGNWRDIFQNWEALMLSYPEFIENAVAKFVNASTIDGYNPYRITKQGIDWEVEEPDDPWSYIGYWGDHQIIYLQKFLELSQNFHPTRLHDLLRQSIFCYANVPYRIKPFAALLEDPKNTVEFDEVVAKRIEHRVAEMGADGKLVLDADGNVTQVNLLEKLLVPLLSKLSNLVINGGIWLNTQRPEWNDANNALVGHGLSMVTLYYLRRYVSFLQQLLANESSPFVLSQEVSVWLAETSAALQRTRPLLSESVIDPAQQFQSLAELGEAASRYRETIYKQEAFSGTELQPVGAIVAMLDDAQAIIDHSISTNRRDDGLYHAYNLLALKNDKASIDTLYPMLEGQVAALSAGSVAPSEVVEVLEALFDSDVYRADQNSFLLYPDRPLPGFLAKNQIDEAKLNSVPLLTQMLAANDRRLVEKDASGCYRFNASFTNASDLKAKLESLRDDYGDAIDTARQSLLELYESVFRHNAFTGRSGTMFGFEGLGSIYWHMVSKLLLAVQENYFTALDDDTDDATRQQLGQMYYRVREGIGFNKTPEEYGAFPTDPYSHTPKHHGAKQPGMTGQVKEEILTRFGELGVRVNNGSATFLPSLLRAQEFLTDPRELRYVDVDGNWQTIAVPSNGLAFTWCQVPVVYQIDDEAPISLTITEQDGSEDNWPQLVLPADKSAELFKRSGTIQRLTLNLHSSMLFTE